MYKALLLISLVCGITITGCGRDTHDHPKNITGKQLFEVHCAACHSSAGTGSILLGVPSNKDSKLLNAQIRNKIQHGSSGDSKMPVFTNMSDTEATKIIKYLREMKRQ